MEKFISADKLFQVLRDDYNIPGACLARVKSHIDAAPDVDAVPVVHGRWIDTDYKPDIYCKCSECGRRVYAYDDGYNYCPNCGAIMDGGDEGNE